MTEFLSALFGALVGGAVTFLVEERNRKRTSLANACGELLSAYMRWADGQSVRDTLALCAAAEKVKLFGKESLFDAAEELECMAISDPKNFAAMRSKIAAFRDLASGEI